MATNLPNLSTDLYDVATLVAALQRKFTDIPDETISLGIYGYLQEMHQLILETTTVQAANYMNEAVPTRAKFERNVICHALSLGIEKIMAHPAWIKVLITIPEDLMIKNMVGDEFVFDKDLSIVLGNDRNMQYNYHLDYDIIIKRNLTPTGLYVYTAYYDMGDESSKMNRVSDIVSPYLPAVGIVNYGASNFIVVEALIREITHNEIPYKIQVVNPLETKTFNFGWQDQLAYFWVEVEENGDKHYLKPVYDGLVETSGAEYCNYLYIDENNIRIKFNRDSYQPKQDAQVTIHVFTTHGDECNFPYVDRINLDMISERIGYKDMYCVITPKGDSQDGANKMSVADIRRAIPKQMLLRGSVTMYTDLNNFFNSLNTGYIRLHFLEKVHNQEERLYFLYLLLKDDNGNIVPTNTLDATVTKNMFGNINAYNNIMLPGAAFYHDGLECQCVETAISPSDLIYCDDNGFLYFCPFMAVFNKNPLFVSYYMTVMSYYKSLWFTYINTDSEVQFVSDQDIHGERLYFTDRDTYRFRATFAQNIMADFSLVTTDDEGNILTTKVKCFGVIYIDDEPYRYIQAELVEYDDRQFLYTFEFTCKTTDVIDRYGRITINEGFHIVNTGMPAKSYMPSNAEMKLFILSEFDTEYGRNFGDIDNILPSTETAGYTLTNVYTVGNGIDFFYDYSNIVGSYVDLGKDDNGVLVYKVKKIPMIRYAYLNTEERYLRFVKILEKRRLYINSSLVVLEDSFGIDFKFFNTYGPSLLYYLEQDSDEKLNRVNMSNTYELKFKTPDDVKILPEVINYIKEYIEDINEVKDMHFSVLQGKVLEKFSEQLVYFQIYDVNGYENDHQNFYKKAEDEFVEAHTVPEFINIHSLRDDSPDIKFRIINDDGSITNA